eukprot:365075-Chlamydomonas_euryale.AAC.12
MLRALFRLCVRACVHAHVHACSTHACAHPYVCACRTISISKRSSTRSMMRCAAFWVPTPRCSTASECPHSTAVQHVWRRGGGAFATQVSTGDCPNLSEMNLLGWVVNLPFHTPVTSSPISQPPHLTKGCKPSCTIAEQSVQTSGRAVAKQKVQTWLCGCRTPAALCCCCCPCVCRSRHSRLAALLLYYGATTGCNSQTLGEEYCNMAQVIEGAWQP